MRTKIKTTLKLFFAVAIVKGLYLVYAKHSYKDDQTQRMISRIENVTEGSDTGRMSQFISEIEEMMFTEKQSKDFEDAVQHLRDRYEYLKTLPPD